MGALQDVGGPQVTGVHVHGLPLVAREGVVPAVHDVLDARPEDRLGDADDHVVHQDVAEQVGRERRRILLDVAGVPVVGGIRPPLERHEVGEHPLVDDVEVGGVDDVVEDHEAVRTQGLDRCRDVLRRHDAARQLVGCDADVHHGCYLPMLRSGTGEVTRRRW